MRFFSIMFMAIVSYIAAAPLSSNISMDLSETNWTSLWTYFFWMTSLGIWLLILLAVLAFIAAWGEWITK